jgi:uncharacterized protein DUF6077
MALLTVSLEGFVVTLFAWVATYETVLYAGLPRRALLLFPMVTVALAAPFLRSWLRRVRATGGGERRFAFGVLLVGCLVATLVLVASRPDADDVPYLLDPLRDAAHPGTAPSFAAFRLPRLIGDPVVPVPGLNRNPAYEALVVGAAGVFGLDPLRAYHNDFAVLLAIIWTLTYAVLLRRFRLPSRWVFPALFALLLLLLLDGNVHRSFGNMSLLRLWQGKVIVFALLLPLLLFLSLRALACPSPRALVLVGMVAVTAIGLNRSALFLVPLLTASVAVAYAIGYGRTRRRLARAALLTFTVVPLLALPALALAVSPTSARRVAEMASGGSGAWWETLRPSVLGNTWVVARNLSVFLLAFLCVRRPLNRLLPLFSAVVCAAALNPWTGPLWHRLLTSEAYWRLYYLLPLPLAFGLTVLAFRDLRPWRVSSGLRLGALALVGASYALSFEQAVLARGNGVELKWPREYRLRSGDLAFARRVAPLMAGKRTLAADPVANVLALAHGGSLDLVYQRAPSADPLDPRVQADHVLSECSTAPEDLEAARALASSAQFVVLRDCPAEVRRALADAAGGLVLQERVREHGFVLLEVTPVR